MGKVIANILLFALAIALAIFTASRTLDLLGQWLPAGQDIYKWLALSAFEGGFALWALFFATSAKGAPQRGLALLMIVVDFLGIAIATIADLVLTGVKDGKLPPLDPNIQQAIVVFIGIVIVINVAAFAAAKLISPEKMREWAVQDAEDTIYAEEQRAIKNLAPSVAGSMAPIRAQQWADQTWDRLLPGTTAAYVEDVTPRYQQQLPRGQQQALPALRQPRVSLAQTGIVARPGEKRGILGKLRDWYNRPSGNDLEGVQVAAAPVQAAPVSNSSSAAEQGGQVAGGQPRPFHSGSGAATAATAVAQQAAQASDSGSAQLKRQRAAARRNRRAARRQGGGQQP